MAFDLSTAVPVDELDDQPRKGKFDITTARPVEELEAERRSGFGLEKAETIGARPPLYGVRSALESPTAHILFPGVGGTLGTIIGAGGAGAVSAGAASPAGAFVGGTTGAAVGESTRQFLASSVGGGPRTMQEAFTAPLGAAATEAAGMGLGVAAGYGATQLARGIRGIGRLFGRIPKVVRDVKTALRRPPVARTTEEVARVPASEVEFLQPQQRAEYFKQQRATIQSEAERQAQQLAAAKQAEASRLARRTDALKKNLALESDEAVQTVRANAPGVLKAKSDRFASIIAEDLASPKAQQAVIRVPRLLEELEQTFKDSPTLLDEALGTLKLDAEKDAVIGLEDLWNRTQALRRTIRRPALGGSSPYTFGDVAADQVSESLIKVLQREGMTHLPKARADWAQWAPIRNVILRRIGLQGERTAGARFFRGVVTDPSRKAMVKDIEQALGTDLTDDLFRTYGRLKGNAQEQQALGEVVKQQVARIKAVEKARLGGQASRAYAINERALAHQAIRTRIRQVGQVAGATAGLAGAGGVLRLLLGSRE